jgi:hypothetical protein
MAGLDPAIHEKTVDPRVKPGDDGKANTLETTP